MLAEPVQLKDGSFALDSNGEMLTKEKAIATTIINKAMKGDIQSITFIENLKLRHKHETEHSN